MSEARLRRVSAFTHFLEAASFSNGEIVNYTNIASECGISSPTVKEYFQILIDTLIGNFVPAYRKKPKRRIVQAPKFYFFDIGIANYLLKRKMIVKGSESFGKAFEHFIYHELATYSSYSGLNYEISYWRTSSQIEVDFILGEQQVAIEVKSTDNVNDRHLKGLLNFSEDYSTEKLFIVSNDPFVRKIGKITILPWKIFLDMLWNGEIIS